MIVQYNTLSPNGYNILPGGEEPPHRYGESHHKCVVTEKQIDIIIEELKKDKLNFREIGELFDPPIRQGLIAVINTGKNHKRDNEEYPIRKSWLRCLKPEVVEEIRWLLKNSLCPYT